MAKRGRPKTIFTDKDLGTPELQEKRKFNMTAEPMDLAFAKGLITEDEQRAGLKFRWLYTLIFGPPTISSYVPGMIKGREISKYQDEDWLSRQKSKFYLIIDVLKKEKLLSATMNFCIYHQAPKSSHEVCKIQLGLKAIVDLISKASAKRSFS
jgi:hypothetical protein